MVAPIIKQKPKAACLCNQPGVAHGVEKLTGFEDSYRVRVGDFRVIYHEIRDAVLIVTVVRVAHRKEAYRRP